MKNEYFIEYHELKESDKFDSNHFIKFEKDIEEIIKPLLNDWTNFNEKETENLVKKFGKLTRDEYSKLNKNFMSDNDVVETLLNISYKYPKNNKILVEIVSSINNMYASYELKITDKVFNFLIAQTKNKSVNFYVSLFITDLNQFNTYEDKWNYIFSIPKIAPKNKSINTFYRIINDNINDISENEKAVAINIFSEYIKENSNLHVTTLEKFSNLIKKMCK
jgi:hypothetical protein